MSGHTPGPWRINSRGSQVGPRSEEDDQSFGMIIPVAYLEEVDWPDAHEANARLIAAAPDLLEALDALLIAYCDPGNQGGDHDEKVEAARAAIAKAKGQPCQPHPKP